MTKIICGTFITIGLLLSGCRTLESGGWTTPEPRSSEYLTTTAGGFAGTLNNGKLEEMYCSYGADISPELPRPAYAKVVFEMPEKGMQHEVVILIEENESSLSATSAGSNSWKHYQGYRVEVFIFSDKAMTQEIDYLEQFVRFQKVTL